MASPIVVPDPVIPLSDVGEVRMIRPPDPPGELKIYVQVLDGQIVMDFGRPVEWVKFTPEAADKLAEDLKFMVHAARTVHLQEG